MLITFNLINFLNLIDIFFNFILNLKFYLTIIINTNLFFSIFFVLFNSWSIHVSFMTFTFVFINVHWLLIFLFEDFIIFYLLLSYSYLCISWRFNSKTVLTVIHGSWHLWRMLLNSARIKSFTIFFTLIFFRKNLIIPKVISFESLSLCRCKIWNIMFFIVTLMFWSVNRTSFIFRDIF
jgi:hypothetical protein